MSDIEQHSALRVLGQLAEALEDELNYNHRRCKLSWETRGALEEAKRLLIAKFGPNWADTDWEEV